MGEIRVKTADGWSTKPAHKKTSTGWQDIPTHTMAANGWQGELTSQSPLKFRADGEMLDWRVEGRKSGNLVDLENYIAYVHNIEITSISNGISIISTSSDDPYINPSYNVVGQQITHPSVKRAMINCKSNTAYTLYFQQSQNVAKRISYFNSEFIVVKGFDAFDGSIFNIITPDDCVYILIRIGNSATLPEGTQVELTNIQLLEGTYTSSTIPEYQPCGGVGDWDETEQKYRIPITVNGVTTNLYTDHQLMDGDSIDYTTTETTIPLATGNNTLMIDTAVQPSKVFIKFEG